MKIIIEAEPKSGVSDHNAIMSALAEVDRELVVRSRVYPGWIAAGKITSHDASRRLASMVVARGALAAIAKALLAGSATDAEVVNSPAPAAEKQNTPVRSVEDLKRESAARAQMNAIFTARKAIFAAAGDRVPTSGHIPCPVCKSGTLNYSIASNDHVHAACTGPDCVRWME